MARLGLISGTVEVGQALGLAVHDFGMLCNDMNIVVDHVDNTDPEHPITWRKSGTERAYRINKWSFKKPIIFPSPISPTDNEIRVAKCGLDIEVSSITDLGIEAINTIFPEQYIWVYNPPTGSASAPFRISDFSYYQPDSKPIFLMNVADDFGVINITQPFPAVSLIHNFDLSQVQEEGGILPSDIKINSTDFLSSYYLGFMVIDLNLNPSQDLNAAIVMIKTATTTINSVKNVIGNFISIPSNTDLKVAFFLSPRTLDMVYPSGGGSIPAQSDYVWLDKCFYDMVLINETAETTIWMFDKTEPSYDTFVESNANSDYYIAESTNFPTNNATYGIWFNTGEFFTLSPEDTVNKSNGYAMRIIMEITGESGGDTVFRNLCTYSTNYDEFLGAPDEWNMIYCKNSNGKFLIGHGNPNDPDPTYEVQTFNYEDVTKIEIRNYYYPSGQINTQYVHVHIFTTDPDTPTTIYSFTASGEVMFTPVYLKFGTYGGFEAPQYMKFDSLKVISTPNTY